MKKIFTLLVAFTCTLNIASAQLTQTCYNQNFNTAPTGWTYSQGASEGTYNNPTNGCASDVGAITPGVGGNNPANLFSPNFTSTGVVIMQIAFDIFRFNSNMNCNSWSDFGCPTSIDIFYYVGSTKHTGITDLVLPISGPGYSPNVSCSFNTAGILPAGTVYRLEIAFKPKSGIGNCGQPGTKYVVDNFKKCEITCVNCGLDAENDVYCLSTNSPTVVTGDLSTNDIKYIGANLTYTLVNGPFANGSSIVGGASLVINPNGTFTMTRTDMTKSIFDFTYRVTDALFGMSDLASGKVCFPDATVLPVTIHSFYVKREGTFAVLDWETLTEVNALTIDIERMDNGNFVKAGSLPAVNNERGNSYSYKEENRSAGVTQYRLRFNDKNGYFSYSEVRTVKGYGTTTDHTIYPNPTNGSAKVTISDISNADRVQVVDNTGRILLTVPATSNGVINTSSLQKGMYFIKISSQVDGKQSTQKLVIN
ncbi:MAG: T9SS type A sorting domain-containing protein [Ferruginibacter sp.]